MSNTPNPPVNQGVPAGWYSDGATPGVLRYWDGHVWTEHTTPDRNTTSSQGPLTHGALNVTRTVFYNRQQKGHSITFWILLSMVIIGVPWLIYYSVSPNHYWHV